MSMLGKYMQLLTPVSESKEQVEGIIVEDRIDEDGTLILLARDAICNCIECGPYLCHIEDQISLQDIPIERIPGLRSGEVYSLKLRQEAACEGFYKGLHTFLGKEGDQARVTNPAKGPGETGTIRFVMSSGSIDIDFGNVWEAFYPWELEYVPVYRIKRSYWHTDHFGIPEVIFSTPDPREAIRTLTKCYEKLYPPYNLRIACVLDPMPSSLCVFCGQELGRNKTCLLCCEHRFSVMELA